jgi:hypothetical protein
MYKDCQNIQPCNKIHDYKGHYIYIYDDKNKWFSNALNSLHRKPSDVTGKFCMFSESFKNLFMVFSLYRKKWSTFPGLVLWLWLD